MSQLGREKKGDVIEGIMAGDQLGFTPGSEDRLLVETGRVAQSSAQILNHVWSTDHALARTWDENVLVFHFLQLQAQEDMCRDDAPDVVAHSSEKAEHESCCARVRTRNVLRLCFNSTLWQLHSGEFGLSWNELLLAFLFEV